MKNFSLGFLAGAAIGIGISFFKNPKTNKTLKSEIKEYFDETNQDVQNIITAGNHLKNSVSSLKATADNSIKTTHDIQKKLYYFNKYANRKVDKINKHTAALDEELKSLDNNMQKN